MSHDCEGQEFEKDYWSALHGSSRAQPMNSAAPSTGLDLGGHRAGLVPCGPLSFPGGPVLSR